MSYVSLIVHSKIIYFFSSSHFTIPKLLTDSIFLYLEENSLVEDQSAGYNSKITTMEGFEPMLGNSIKDFSSCFRFYI